MQSVSFAGDTYSIPTVRGDRPWSGLSDFVIAAASKCINTGGGNFTLLADVNFGASFGLVSGYYKSRTAGIADAGQLRLANTDSIRWRNAAGDGNLSLALSTNTLQFNGASLLTAGIGSIVNADISASAAIAFSKLATLTSGNLLVGSAGNVPTSVAMSGDASIIASGALTLATVNSDVGSFTSANITVNAKGLITAASNGSSGVTSVTGTANQITSTGGATPVLAIASPLTLPGAMTAGGAIAMGTNKITGLGNGTAAQDAVAFSQLKVVGTFVIGTGTTSSSTTSSTFADTVITAAITPSSASNRVLAFVSGVLRSADLNSTIAEATLKRTATNLGSTHGFVTLSSSDLDAAFDSPFSFCYIDSPATTSATTYTVQIRSTNNTNTVTVNPNANTWVIILVEVV